MVSSERQPGTGLTAGQDLEHHVVGARGLGVEILDRQGIWWPEGVAAHGQRHLRRGGGSDEQGSERGWGRRSCANLPEEGYGEGGKMAWAHCRGCFVSLAVTGRVQSTLPPTMATPT